MFANLLLNAESFKEMFTMEFNFEKLKNAFKILDLILQNKSKLLTDSNDKYKNLFDEFSEFKDEKNNMKDTL
jgi:hypothetical protein